MRQAVKSAWGQVKNIGKKEDKKIEEIKWGKGNGGGRSNVPPTRKFGDTIKGKHIGKNGIKRFSIFPAMPNPFPVKEEEKGEIDDQKEDVINGEDTGNR